MTTTSKRTALDEPRIYVAGLAKSNATTPIRLEEKTKPSRLEDYRNPTRSQRARWHYINFSHAQSSDR